MKQKKKRLLIWVEKIMKKRMSISSYRIYQTSFSMYQYSITRNKALIGIVILIACMLTMLTGLIVNVGANWNKSQIRLLGSDAKLMVQISKDELLDNLYNQRQIEAVGLIYPLQEVEGFLVCYTDDVCWKSVFLPALGNIEGEYPKKENEIMVSRRYLMERGYQSTKIGEEIRIKKLGNFRVSGVFTDYSRAVGVQNLYISKEYAKKQHKLEKENRKAMLTSDLEQYYLKAILEEDCDIPSKDISFLEYQSVDRDCTIVILKWILGFLFFCGGIAVYHVFYTVVSADRKFYGLFAVIGMSREHVFDCMKWQGGFVAIPGILVGVSLGTLGQIALVPWFMKRFLGASQKVREYLVTEVELYPVIPFIAAILVVGMVFAGFCMVAVRISRLSPIECLKGSGAKRKKKLECQSNSAKRKRRKSLRSSKKSLWNLAYHHQKNMAGANLLTGFSILISNQFFLVVYAIAEYYKGTEQSGIDFAQRADSIAVLGNFIGIILYCTEMIRLYSVMYIKLQTRKKQIKLLRQIGMNRKQLNTMITIEGLIQFLYFVFVAGLLEGPLWCLIAIYAKQAGGIRISFPFTLALILFLVDFAVFLSSAKIGFSIVFKSKANLRNKYEENK